jgi:uncharacterized membrane protein
MQSVAKVSGHPIHPMLVGFPVAMYTATLAAYLAYAIGSDPFWFRAGFAANVAGIATAVIAAIPGFFDWLLAIPSRTEAKGVGTRHMALNLMALGSFTVNAWLFDGYWSLPPNNIGLGIVLAAVGVGLTSVAGWLGWSMVETHHVGLTMLPAPAPIDYIEDHRRAA